MSWDLMCGGHKVSEGTAQLPHLFTDTLFPSRAGKSHGNLTARATGKEIAQPCYAESSYRPPVFGQIRDSGKQNCDSGLCLE